MKLLKTYYDTDVFSEFEIPTEDTDYFNRLTGKAIIIDQLGNIALVGTNKNTIFQFPGGGIYEGEDPLVGTIRECREETGCTVELIKEIGAVDDYRSRDKKHTLAYCYAVRSKMRGAPNLMENEERNGMFTIWARPEDVRLIFRSQKERLMLGDIRYYNTGFNIMRDNRFLDEFLKLLKIGEIRI